MLRADAILLLFIEYYKWMVEFMNGGDSIQGKHNRKSVIFIILAFKTHRGFSFYVKI